MFTCKCEKYCLFVIRLLELAELKGMTKWNKLFQDVYEMFVVTANIEIL